MRQSPAGLSLAETVIGLFLLTFGILISVRLLDAGLQHQAATEKRAIAVKLAEKSMAELRGWARSSIPLGAITSEYNFDSISWAPAVPKTDPDYPGFEVKVFTSNATLYSPCKEFEEPYIALGTARAMTRSARNVKITVFDPANPGFSVELVSLITDPSRHLSLVTMSSIGNPAPAKFEQAGDLKNPAPNSFVEYEAKGHYSDGSEIPDLMFDWYTVPMGGNGTVTPSRDGRTAKFINGIQMNLAAPPIYTAGAVAFAVHGQYRGQGQPPQEWTVATPNPFIAVDLPLFQLK